MVVYPTLAGEIAKRGIKKKAVAQAIGVSYRSFDNKMKNVSPFTWPEVSLIRNIFFPDLTVDELFAISKEESPICPGQDPSKDRPA